MRVGILQFAPRLGEPEANQARAEVILAEAGLGGSTSGSFPSSTKFNDSVDAGRPVANENGPRLDLLVLPEMAFSGYNFPDLDAITPFLECTAAGSSARWAARTAYRLQCLVAVGYPETTTTPAKVPRYVDTDGNGPGAGSADVDVKELEAATRQNFNSLIIVNPEGEVVAHYRKTHLYYTDATWAAPSPEGFIPASLPLTPPLPLSPSHTSATSTTTSFAICMDLNQQYFTAPWDAYEAARAAQRANASLLIASNAWISSAASLDPESAKQPATEPDFDTIAHWLERLRPLLDAEGNETLVVLANRTGIEPGECRAFELDPVIRAVKMTERVERQRLREQRLEELLKETEQHAAQNEAMAAAVPGSEPVVVDPPPIPSGPFYEEDDDEKGRAFLQEVRYAGSSAILALGGGRASVHGVLGRAEEKVLIIDTQRPPKQVWRLSRKVGPSSDGDRDREGANGSDGSSGGDIGSQGGSADGDVD